MERSPRPRKTHINLSESLQKRLNSYALAASAAGVGMLALTQPAQAKIVYTKAHEVIGLYGLHSYSLDLNHDGIVDFTINWWRNTSAWREGLGVSGVPTTNSSTQCRPTHACPWRNQIVGNRSQQGGAYPLEAGARIGPKGPFVRTGGMVSLVGITYISNYFTEGYRWANVQNHYLGLKFLITEKGVTGIHYGWARLSVKVQTSGVTALLTGYAYETIPNKPIIAGKTHGADDAEQPAPAFLTRPAEKPATLGLLALGAPGLSIWKREGSPQAAQPVLWPR